MSAIKLLVADTDRYFIGAVSNYFSKTNDIQVTGVCSNSSELLEQVRLQHPDAVLTELILAGLDGIAVLKTLHNLSQQSRVIICTEFYNELCIRRACRFGASAFLCKPVCLQSLHDTVVESCDPITGGISNADFALEYPHSEFSEADIVNHLISLGISQESEGFRYLCDAVGLVRRRPELISSMTKLLYPELARINSTTPACAERNIRTAVQHAFANGGLIINGHKPTNREMIVYLADAVSNPA